MRVLTFLSLLLIAGCGKSDSIPAPVAVAGQIKFKGKPVSGAVVSYYAISAGLPAKYRFNQCTTNEDGEYSLPEVYPAEYEVSIIKLAERKLPKGASQDGALSDPGDPAFAKYAAGSPLRSNVSKEAKRFDFDLGI